MKRMVWVLFFCVLLAGCSIQKKTAEPADFQEIYTEQVSPNQAYVESEEDVVYYTVRVYQNKDGMIAVDASSNIASSKPQRYTLECDKKIDKEDISVTWTTLMGNPEAAKDDQLALADIVICAEGEITSERKVNFVKGEIDIIVDIMDRKQA